MPHHHHKAAVDHTIRVSAGSSPQTLKPVNPNDEHNPILIDNDHFIGYLLVRVVNFSGLPPTPTTPIIPNPPSEYFKGRNRRYSIAIQGRWKKQWGGDDIVFGMDFDTRLRMPTGASVGLKIAKWLDPALEADLWCEKPWLYTPLVSAMNAMAVYEVDDPEVRGGGSGGSAGSSESSKPVKGNKVSPVSKPSGSGSTPTTPSNPSLPSHQQQPSIDIGTWSFASRSIPESTSLLFSPPSSSPTTHTPSTTSNPPQLPSYDKRKKFFATAPQRSLATLHPSYIYAMDFYDAYFDFTNVSLKFLGSVLTRSGTGMDSR